VDNFLDHGPAGEEEEEAVVFWNQDDKEQSKDVLSRPLVPLKSNKPCDEKSD